MGLALYWLGSCLLGSIPFALLLGRALGVDIRKIGSGNVGATNLVRARGIGWGIVAFFLDAGKGWLPVFVGSHLWRPDREWACVVAGATAVLGHCYSPYLRFRGGKGVATSAGVLAGLEPLLLLALLCLWAFFLGLLRNVGMSSSLAALAAAGLGVWYLVEGERRAFAIFLLALAALVLLRHRRNIRKFLASTSSVEGPGPG